MAIVISLIWGAIITAMVFCSIKWYLPALRAKNSEEEVLSIEKISSGKMYITILVLSLLVSLICGFISGNRHDEILNMCKMILALGVLNVVAITDFELFKIPNLCSLVLIAGRLISIIPEVIMKDDTLLLGLINSAIAAVCCLLFLLLMSKITRGGIGYGDVKIFSALGFLCGVRAVVYTLIISFFVCSIVSVTLLVTKKKKMKDGLPMGPFIWIGFAISIALGLC